jgi:ABC-type branched-subunit amino acid transport system substrate-binding protein
MRRRNFIKGIVGSAAAWPLAVRAQQPAMPVIGYLSGATFETMRDYVAAFHRGLAEAGFAEGRNVAIEYRWAEESYPGNQEFVAAYAKEFSHPPAVQSAGSYAGCQLLIDAIQRTGSLDSEKLREALLTLKTKTVFGDFAVDERGYQTAHKAVTIQWQDGKQVVVWPDEVATGKARLPTPMWSTR